MYDALILAGGSARRLGGVDKPALDVGGRTLLEHVVAAVAGAERVVVVGPRRPLAVAVDVRWCVEDPPGGGPVAGLAAGLMRTSAEVVLVLAADLPAVAPAVPALLQALDGDPGVAVAALVDTAGCVNQLAAAWRRTALVEALAAVGDPGGAPVRALTATARAVLVPDPDGWGRDCDTWPDVAAARAGRPPDQQASRPSPA